MAIISDKLNKILSAVFGKDVRQALHDGLDAINKETESTTSRQDYLDRKYDEQIKNMTLQDPSSAEIVDMRVAANGKTFKKAGDRLNYFDEILYNIAIDVESFGFEKGINADKESNTKLIQLLIDRYDDLVLYFPSGINRLGHLNLGTDKNITFRGKSSAFATSVNKSVSNPRIIDTYTRIVINDENEYWLEHDNPTIY